MRTSFRQWRKNFAQEVVAKPFYYFSLFFYSVIMMLFCFFIYSLISKYFFVYKMFDSSGLKNHIVYYDTIGYTERFFSDNYTELPELLNSVEGVEQASYFSNGGITLSDGKNVMDIQDYSSVSENYIFNLVDGRKPESGSNEVLIPEEMASDYKVGDVIEFDNISLTVVGIYSSDTLILNTSRISNPPTLTNRFTKYSIYMERENPPVVIGFNFNDSDGNELFAPNFIAVDITVSEGYTQDEVKANIQAVVFDDNDVITYDEMSDNFLQDFYENQKGIIRMFVVALILLVSAVFTNTISDIQKDFIDFKVKYLCGLTWKKCVWFEYINSIFTVFLSVCPSMILTGILSRTILGSDIALFTPAGFLIPATMYLGLFAVVSFCCYLGYFFINPEIMCKE